MSANGFYSQIDAFDDFAEIANIDNYVVAPDDWHVVISDVEGSTRTIAEGRYKEVNMIGAACINAVLNLTTGGEIPYVFGGDGATLLVPAARVTSWRPFPAAVSNWPSAGSNRIPPTWWSRRRTTARPIWTVYPAAGNRWRRRMASS